MLSSALPGCGGGGSSDQHTATPSSDNPAAAPTDATSAMLSRIRAAMADAAQANALTAPPLTALPSWSASAHYAQGDVVRGLGSDSTHTYICFEASGSPKFGRPGPSGTGDGPIHDGYATWYYDGEARTPMHTNQAPTVRWGVMADLLKGFTHPQTLTPTVSAPLFDYTGGIVELDTALNSYPLVVRSGNQGTQAAPSYGNPFSAMLGLSTNSDLIVFQSYDAIYDQHRAVLTVNGQRLSDGQATMLFGTVGQVFNPGGLLLDFRGTALAGQAKRIQLQTMSGLGFLATHVVVEQGSTVLADPPAHRWKLAVDGDSLTQGGYHTPYQIGRDWVTQVGRLLGADAANFAVGGTGFLSDYHGGRTTYIQRVERLAALNADVYLIAGNHNDSGYPAQQQVDAALAYFKRLRALQPQALIVVAGPNPLQGESVVSGPLVEAEKNLRKAFDAWGDAHAWFVPVTTDPDGPWVTGTGAADAPKGDGNMDHYYVTADGHPLQRGVDYFAQRYAQALRKVLGAP